MDNLQMQLLNPSTGKVVTLPISCLSRNIFLPVTPVSLVTVIQKPPCPISDESEITLVLPINANPFILAYNVPSLEGIGFAANASGIQLFTGFVITMCFNFAPDTPSDLVLHYIVRKDARTIAFEKTTTDRCLTFASPNVFLLTIVIIKISDNLYDVEIDFGGF